MEERIELTSIFKSSDPEKLIVFQASSLQNEIRFYFNDTQYLAAVEGKEECYIRLGDTRVDEKSAKELHSKRKKIINREFLTELLIIVGGSILAFIGLIYFSKIINNTLIFLIIMNVIFFIINIVNVVIIETMETNPALKSKHSAEHMMVNFLEMNKRLPKNIEEVKKSSRFSPDCGSRKLIKGIAEELIQSIIATLFTVIVSMIVSKFSSDAITYVIVFVFTYYSIKLVIGKVIIKNSTLDFIINPIKKVLTNIAQCANTTSKVKDKDIILAYSVAKPWLQVVYPEFYNENEDIFWKQY